MSAARTKAYRVLRRNALMTSKYMSYSSVYFLKYWNMTFQELNFGHCVSFLITVDSTKILFLILQVKLKK